VNAKNPAPGAGPFTLNVQIRTLVAEEQPQQDDHRNRNAQQPKQKTSAHIRLLTFTSLLNRRNNAIRPKLFRPWKAS
jgi:hypothetical protein